MELKEIMQLADIGKRIEELKKRPASPEIKKLAAEFDQQQHKVMDTSERPDKIVRSGTPVDDGGDGVTERSEPVARIALALQKLIVKRRRRFFTPGNPVKYYYATVENEQQKILYEAVKKNYGERENKFI